MKPHNSLKSKIARSKQRKKLRLLIRVQKTKNLFKEIFTKNTIILSASINPSLRNWGDDVSSEIVKCINPELTVIQRKHSWNISNKPDYLCIGSIITWMTTSKSIIWGSGVVYPDKDLSKKPHKVLAVRGPLTRDYLLRQGVECPEIYGDPALLFPRYYTPRKSNRRYRLGIIPHFRDKDNEILSKLTNDKSILIIDTQDVACWTDFIDAISSCDFVASSSLHGVIMADAYDTPNLWIEFEGGEQKKFAFHDYFASVDKDIKEPYIIKDTSCLEDIYSHKSLWKKPNIDLDLLLSVCPFNTTN